ncbi:hypothetical protein M404DRAFT_9606 [Pisolithus tinctorius Marx 270]|uniref:Uncharacterized protein n=1 Tax=Pisolithus tinctorius Marx 270 TaxID=870435 RepID=A0A0C3J1X6_PISTI|nr:hypothetical protein M404DRAFT_9606 [Pisolithus tinctorius Marx 270]
MVFTRLSTQEKEAFFGLLDEYFQSRPELFGNGGVGSGIGLGISPATATSAVQRALSSATGDDNNNGGRGSASTPGVRTIPGGRLAGNNALMSSASAALTCHSSGFKS